jgi:hypothetical protein
MKFNAGTVAEALTPHLEAVFDPRCIQPLTFCRSRLISSYVTAQNGFTGLHPIAMSMGLAIQKIAAHRKTPYI